MPILKKKINFLNLTGLSRVHASCFYTNTFIMFFDVITNSFFSGTVCDNYELVVSIRSQTYDQKCVWVNRPSAHVRRSRYMVSTHHLGRRPSLINNLYYIDTPRDTIATHTDITLLCHHCQSVVKSRQFFPFVSFIYIYTTPKISIL